MDVEDLLDEYAKPVNMKEEHRQSLIDAKELGWDYSDFVLWSASDWNFLEEDLMRAWLHPELIEVNEDE